jgi:hypothetical protein
MRNARKNSGGQSLLAIRIGDSLDSALRLMDAPVLAIDVLFPRSLKSLVRP